MSFNSIINIVEIVIIAALLILIIRQKNKRKQTMERQRIQNAKMRNDELENKLKNPNMGISKNKGTNPYDVQYKEEVAGAKSEAGGAQVEIEMQTKASIQRFLFTLEREITIGSDPGSSLPLSEPMAASTQCAIFRNKGSIYLKNMAPNKPITIQRGKNRQTLEKQMVKLMSKDTVTIGETTLLISLFND